MRLAVVVPFLDEERYMPTFLASLEAQLRVPDRLLLVDDGSSDGSPVMAQDYADRHPYASLLRRPRRERGVDRLVDASELCAFLTGVEHLDGDWDVVVKMDADLQLAPDLFAELEGRFLADPGLGIAGGYLSASPARGSHRREQNPAYHARGPNKFYRKACFEDIMPVPAVLGWDTIDEMKARMHGWRTQSFELPSGDSIHLRPTGTHDGALRGFRRDGRGAWVYGAHPLWILLGMARRMRNSPRVLGGINYGIGWSQAALRRVPRADDDVRRFARHEQLQRIRAALVPRSPSHSLIDRALLVSRVHLKPFYTSARYRATKGLERRVGIETARYRRLADFGLEHPQRVNYEPSGWFTLRRALPRSEISESDVFLDLGCGMGRVMFQAARLPFRRVIGVDVAEPLVDIARANIERTRDRLRCSEVEVVCADAVDYEIPDDVTVVYFYNPFRGDLFHKVLANVLASLDRRPRPLRVIYRTPEEHDQLIGSGRFRVVRIAKGRRPGVEWARTSSTIVYESLPVDSTGVDETIARRD